MANLIRYRVTELDIREWLDKNGFEGGSAKLESVELHAIKRPGWEQLFRFSGKIRKQSGDLDETPPKVAVWGAVLNDERLSVDLRTRVFLFETEAEQLGKLERLSVDLLTVSRPNERAKVWRLVLVAFFAALIFLLIAMVKRFYG